MSDEAIIKRLDTIAAILRIAHGNQIEAARASIMNDGVNKEIVPRASDWVAAGALQKVVMQKTKESQSTVKRRIANLVERGVLERRGAGPSVEYKTTGLI